MGGDPTVVGTGDQDGGYRRRLVGRRRRARAATAPPPSTARPEAMRAARTAVLRVVAAGLAEPAPSIDATLAVIADQASTCLGGPVALRRLEGARLRSGGAGGVGVEILAPLSEAAVERHPAVLEPGAEGSPVSRSLEDLERGGEPDLARALDARGVRAVLFVPLTDGVDAVGHLVAGRSVAFDDEEAAFAGELGQLAAMALTQAAVAPALQARRVDAADPQDLQRTVRLLRDAVADRQALMRRLMRAQEDERRRIAADIHDDSLQALLAVGLRVQYLRRTTDDPAVVEQVGQVEKAVAEAATRLRELLFDLRPPSLDRGGLGVALEDLGHELVAGTDVTWRLESRLGTEPPEPVQSIVYRIAREALTNVAKHAEATTVTAVLAPRQGGVHLRLEDDGCGFDPSVAPAGHFGLVQMREQAELAGGWLRVESEPGRGTTVQLWLPGDEPPRPRDPDAEDATGRPGEPPGA
ncbi:MAG TPA: GAF domain-containing sensor histidine kinase [Acidimicrobiales bacterium]|nr:GAF domain-containing sensor histidine kinase [Acidimicrobiales bacterium]